jgi:hypothetical protein
MIDKKSTDFLESYKSTMDNVLLHIYVAEKFTNVKQAYIPFHPSVGQLHTQVLHAWHQRPTQRTMHGFKKFKTL